MNDRPLTIFLVSFDWSDLAGRDPKTFISRLDRDKLHPDKNRFVIWSWGKGRYERDLSNTVHIIRRRARFPALRPLYDVLSWILIPRYLAHANFKPDMVLVYDFPLALAVSRAAERVGAPLVLGLTNIPRAYINARNSLRIPKMLYQRLTERLAAPHIRAVYTINEAIRDYAQARGIPKNRIVVFTTDVITRDKAFIERADPHFLRTKFPIPADHKILLCSARFHTEKGLDVLIDAFSRFSNKKLTLVLAGTGPLETELRTLVKRRGVEGRVIFVGHLARPDMWSAYKGADVFILLSKAEGLGLVFWEAMYAGTPVIGSRADGIEETIGKNEERGYLWEPKDGIAALEKKVQMCLNCEAEVMSRVSLARSYVENVLSNRTDITSIYTLCTKY